MTSPFSRKFSPEWEAERELFYRGVHVELGDESADDWAVKLGFGNVPMGNLDASALREAAEALAGRVRNAHELLAGLSEGPLAPWTDEGGGVSEVLSDCAVILTYLVDALADDGAAGEPAMQIKRRGGGRPQAGVGRVRAGFAWAEAVDRLVEKGVKQESAIEAVCARSGFSRSTLMDWLAQRRKALAITKGVGLSA